MFCHSIPFWLCSVNGNNIYNSGNNGEQKRRKKAKHKNEINMKIEISIKATIACLLTIAGLLKERKNCGYI